MTHREVSRSFHVLTGHTVQGLPEQLDRLAGLEGEINETRATRTLAPESVIAALDTLGRRLAEGEAVYLRVGHVRPQLVADLLLVEAGGVPRLQAPGLRQQLPALGGGEAGDGRVLGYGDLLRKAVGRHREGEVRQGKGDAPHHPAGGVAVQFPQCEAAPGVSRPGLQYLRPHSGGKTVGAEPLLQFFQLHMITPCSSGHKGWIRTVLF